jgi:hypothetical protein
MKMSRRPVFLCITLIISLCINATSVFAESSPAASATGFTKAYYMLDPSMKDYLCETCKETENERNVVDLYLKTAEWEAGNRGYKLSYLKMMPILVKTEILSQDDASAKVQVKATLIRSINPLFRMVGYLFCILEEHEKGTVLDLVNENGEWKIGPGAFDLPQ